MVYMTFEMQDLLVWSCLCAAEMAAKEVTLVQLKLGAETRKSKHSRKLDNFCTARMTATGNLQLLMEG